MSFFDPNGAKSRRGRPIRSLGICGSRLRRRELRCALSGEDWYGPIAPRLGADTSSTIRPFSDWGGGLLPEGVLSGDGAAGSNLSGFFNSDVSFSSAPRRHPAGVLPRETGFPLKLPGAALHPVGLPQRPERLLPTAWTRRAPILAPVEHHGGSGDRAKPFSSQRGLCWQCRSSASLEHRLRSMPSTPRTHHWAMRSTTSSKPGMTSLDGLPLPYAGWVEQMTGVCALGRPGVTAISRRTC